MSYDVTYRQSVCPHCGRGDDDAAEDRNITYNVARIFAWAFGHDADTPLPVGVRWLDGKTGAETIEVLRAASKKMSDPANEEVLKAMAPSNGWGSPESVRKDIGWMIRQVEESPEGTWSVS